MKFIGLKLNKRGAGEPRSEVITAVVAGFVLVLVLLGVYFYFNGSTIPFFQNLPGFNQTKPLVTNEEILRFNMAEAKVQFYDGVRWNDFETQKEVILNDKKIIYQSVYGMFSNALYVASSESGNVQKKITLSDGSNMEIKSFIFYPRLTVLKPRFIGYSFVTLNSIIFVTTSVAGSQREFMLNINNIFYSVSRANDVRGAQNFVVSIAGNDETSAKVKEEAIAWRNGIMNKFISMPIKIDYIDLNTKQNAYVSVCAKNIENNLVVWLDQPAIGDSCL